MNDYFLSDEFALLLTPLTELLDNDELFSEDVLESIVGATIKYYTFLDTAGNFSIEKIDTFVKSIVDYVNTNINSIRWNINNELADFSNQYFIDKTLDMLGVKEEEMTLEAKEALGKYFVIVSEKYTHKFHGFNSCFLDSIKENGINPNVKENQEEIKIINEIYLKYGIQMALGWSEFDHGKVSYSETPMVSYDYAKRSPEWFSNFVYGSNKNAFRDKDFEGAKNNIIEKMDAYNFSQEDRQIVMDFFVKNWQKYTSSKPMIAMVKEKKSQEVLDKLTSIYQEQKLLSKFPFILSFYDYNIDLKSEEPIDTTNALFIELPHHKELIDKIHLLKEEFKTK